MTQPSHPDDVTRARLIPPVPVAVAPMAGGPSTPELVAAVVGAGGGGFLAGGMRTAAQMRAQVDALRALLGAEGPDRWGVNLFVPDAVNTAIPDAARTEAARSARTAAVAAYRAGLTADGAAGLPTAADVVPDPDAERADFDALLTAAEEQAWPLVSFTFGLPAADVFARLAAAGIPAGATVTDATEARAALDHGAAFLVVQGHRAGGHRGTSDPAAEPTRAELPTVLAAVRDVVGTGAASAMPV
ncbi:nitronate monooxygenase, partial [Micrococcus luteus]|uniref:nitronate monooxygenase n=2 Tax=Micrococcaceae TaxID=1268 RepID=UPI001C8D4D42